MPGDFQLSDYFQSGWIRCTLTGNCPDCDGETVSDAAGLRYCAACSLNHRVRDFIRSLHARTALPEARYPVAEPTSPDAMSMRFDLPHLDACYKRVSGLECGDPTVEDSDLCAKHNAEIRARYAK